MLDKAGSFRICQAKDVGGSWHWFDLVLLRWLSDRVEVYQQKRLKINHEFPGREKGAMRESEEQKREMLLPLSKVLFVTYIQQ